MDRPRVRLDKIQLDTLLYHLHAWNRGIVDMRRGDVPLTEIDSRREQAVIHWQQIRAIVATLDDADYAHVSDLISQMVSQMVRQQPPPGGGNPA